MPITSPVAKSRKKRGVKLARNVSGFAGMAISGVGDVEGDRDAERVENDNRI
jgi:hypothetical protein|tara:strand:- start:16710 stop:16865 length:156 start_codon:yes stop_codon:yes gene_type:complete